MSAAIEREAWNAVALECRSLDHHSHFATAIRRCYEHHRLDHCRWRRGLSPASMSLAAQPLFIPDKPRDEFV